MHDLHEFVIHFQGSVLVKHFTKFTKDIFASLVSLLFIFSALKKLHKVRNKIYCVFLDIGILEI